MFYRVASRHVELCPVRSSARVAQVEWAKTSFAERKRVLACLQNYILDNQDDIARVASRDSGKPRKPPPPHPIHLFFQYRWTPLIGFFPVSLTPSLLLLLVSWARFRLVMYVFYTILYYTVLPIYFSSRCSVYRVGSYRVGSYHVPTYISYRVFVFREVVGAHRISVVFIWAGITFLRVG